tara:strand:+ start:1124 stop:1846 length:723 start_codon:yes stop_codon:yes gene_type:complete
MSKFWDKELPVGYYDKIVTHGLKENKGLQANWHNSTFLKVKKYISKDDIHLDFACGSGTFIGKYLYNNSLGVDISNNQISYAKNEYGNTIYKTTHEFDLEKNKNKYDVITVIGLLEFLDNKESLELIDSLYPLLKENGEILFTTPNFRSLMSFFLVILNVFGKVNYSKQYKNKHTLNSLNNLLNSNKYGEVKTTKFLNFGIFFSLLNIQKSLSLMKKIDNLFNNNFGYLLIGKIKKYDEK